MASNRLAHAWRKASAAVGLVLVLLLTSPAVAHVPRIGAPEGTIDASRSWAFYEQLAPGETQSWTFDLQRGDTVFIVVSVPLDASWTPAARLAGPGILVPMERVDRVGYEFATPYASHEIWQLDAPAPVTGTYQLTITGDGGPYALGFGLKEAFTPLEWVSVPVDALRIHQWTGQPAWLLTLPYAVGLLIAGALTMRHPARGRRLPRLAAALFAGSGLERALQMGIAISSGASGSTWGWSFTGVVILISVSLAWGAWRAHNAWAFVAIGLTGLVAWAGLIVGPVLAMIAGLTAILDRRRTASPPRRVGRRHA